VVGDNEMRPLVTAPVRSHVAAARKNVFNDGDHFVFGFRLAEPIRFEFESVRPILVGVIGFISRHGSDRVLPYPFRATTEKSRKEISMRGVFLFIAGIMVGTIIQTGIAQSPSSQPAVRLNHVAISVPDVAQAVSYYGEKLGFREVVRNTSPQGQLASAYIQVS